MHFPEANPQFSAKQPPPHPPRDSPHEASIRNWALLLDIRPEINPMFRHALSVNRLMGAILDFAIEMSRDWTISLGVSRFPIHFRKGYLSALWDFAVMAARFPEVVGDRLGKIAQFQGGPIDRFRKLSKPLRLYPRRKSSNFSIFGQIRIVWLSVLGYFDVAPVRAYDLADVRGAIATLSDLRPGDSDFTEH